MLTRFAKCMLLVSLSFPIFAKAPNALCADFTPPGFVSGDGSKTNPYLVCSPLDFRRIATELPLLDKHYRLGADLSFQGFIFPMIGSESAPFVGTFDGNGYTMSSISLDIDRGTYLAPFPYVKNGKIENLSINGMTSKKGSNIVGGVVGKAENASLINIHVTGLNLPAPNHSGGLVGELIDGVVLGCSTEGTMVHNFGTDGVGGLVGYASNSDITGCSSNVKQEISAITLPLSTSAIGGVIGNSINSRVRAVYAIGNIDYGTLDASNVAGVGGVVGTMSNSLLTQAYYAGKLVVANAQAKGGAVGAMSDSIAEDVFWDRQVSGVTVSAAGQSKTTATLKKKSFWVSQDFDQYLWRLVSGKYPALFGADGVQ